MKNIAIILAGGVGNRLNAGIPKQFIKVAGKTILEYTISAFQNNVNIHEIALVINPQYVNEAKEIVENDNFPKLRRILKGGKERYSSSIAALKEYGDTECNLIFHDAVRPLVSQRIIDDVVISLAANVAIGVGVSTTDTIWEKNNIDNSINKIPDRTLLVSAQTPQAFRADIINKAYNLALNDPEFIATDDCGVVKKYLPNTKISIVEGDSSNIKITYKEDVDYLEFFISKR